MIHKLLLLLLPLVAIILVGGGLYSRLIKRQPAPQQIGPSVPISPSSSVAPRYEEPQDDTIDDAITVEEATAQTPPSTPQNLKAYVSNQVVRLEWDGAFVGDDYYYVYRKVKDRPWERIGKIKADPNFGLDSYNFEDRIFETSQRYFYSVSEVTLSGLESQLSTPVEVTLEQN